SRACSKTRVLPRRTLITGSFAGGGGGGAVATTGGTTTVAGSATAPVVPDAAALSPVLTGAVVLLLAVAVSGVVAVSPAGLPAAIFAASAVVEVSGCWSANGGRPDAVPTTGGGGISLAVCTSISPSSAKIDHI